MSRQKFNGAEIAPSRGRPPFELPDRLAAKTWYWEVKYRSGYQSDYALEYEFVRGRAKLKGEQFEFKRTGRFGQYKKGTVPKDDVLEFFDGLYPGTKALIKHVFWKSISPSLPSPDEVRALAVALSLPETPIDPARSTDDPLVTQGLTKAAAKRLEHRGDLDALAMLFLLIADADHQRRPLQYDILLRHARFMFYRLALTSPLYSTCEAIYSYLQSVFTHRRAGSTLDERFFKAMPIKFPQLIHMLDYRHWTIVSLEELGIVRADVRLARAILYLVDEVHIHEFNRRVESFRDDECATADRNRFVGWFYRRLRGLGFRRGDLFCDPSERWAPTIPPFLHPNIARLNSLMTRNLH